ncbi:MAG: hypothetical protein KA408_02960 [Flavobacteriales bacterium]|nr:hypothetical protein [Flavobacteriales bacterium]
MMKQKECSQQINSQLVLRELPNGAIFKSWITENYIHVSTKALGNIPSPLEDLDL